MEGDTMGNLRIWLSLAVVSFLFSTGLLYAACADDGGGKGYLPPVDNATYKEKCGACHFTYQPGLLPSGSWERILAGLDDHHSASLEFSPESIAEISEYLKANAAEHSSAKRSVKIMKSLKGQTPLRITETPYIMKKHDDIKAEVFERESIKSRSNCPACHTTAKDGIYREKYVEIPK
jgi:hypothetical protein